MKFEVRLILTVCLAVGLANATKLDERKTVGQVIDAIAALGNSQYLTVPKSNADPTLINSGVVIQPSMAGPIGEKADAALIGSGVAIQPSMVGPIGEKIDAALIGSGVVIQPSMAGPIRNIGTNGSAV
jgi:hypothetical protein